MFKVKIINNGRQSVAVKGRDRLETVPPGKMRVVHLSAPMPREKVAALGLCGASVAEIEKGSIEEAPVAAPADTITVPATPTDALAPDMNALMARADELGVVYAKNIREETLAKRIAEAEVAAGKKVAKAAKAADDAAAKATEADAALAAKAADEEAAARAKAADEADKAAAAKQAAK